jgi:Bacterial regulatory protein, Fis family
MQSNQDPFVIEKQKEKMITALEANRGNVSKAAKLAEITPKTHYRWRKEDERYESRTDSLKDICYRDIKENLIDTCLELAEKGNERVLIKLMGIFLKDLPEEMKTLNRMNNVPLIPKINYVDKPPGWDEEMKKYR